MSQHTCPGCGQALNCSADKNCWCMKMPSILPVSADLSEQSCYCAPCLAKKLSQKLDQLCQTMPHHELLALAQRYQNNQSPLQQHIDYQEKDGLMVFSAWYHLKRGSCCGSGCRNCPYPKRQRPK
ncbi:DUF5522 domain-containing protein [Agarivorans sp. QJM3NY_29]|uniref:DUF5522 domain-containing protein n=1 Tax=unclassified Agarivorans TaxID=2636026 RepID=UPI003D7D028B